MACTCAMIRRSSRHITQVYDTALRPTGLRITQYSILANLARLQSVSITDLAEVLATDRTTLTRNLRPLQRDGLVALGEGPDKRSKTLRLTSRGQELLEQARPLWRDAERTLRDRFGEDNIAQLRTLLDRISQTV